MSESVTLSSRYELMRERASGVLCCFAVFLTFLLPLKFGIMTGVPEVATTLPSNILSVVLIFWPPLFFSLLSSLLLIGVLFFTPPPEYSGRSILLIPLSWFFLFLAVFPGFIHGSTVDFSVIQVSLFGGYAAFCFSIYRLIAIRPELKIWLINAIVLSTIVTLLLGLNQYLYGFRETLDYIYSKELESGHKVSASMMARLVQTRVFATFSICNSLGAHIILTLPVCIWGILKSKLILKSVILLTGLTLLFVFMPPATSSLGYLVVTFVILSAVSLLLLRFPENGGRYIAIFALISVLLLLFFVLRHTYSRGAFLGLGCGFIFCTLVIPVKWRYKSAFIFFIALGSILLISSDYAERSFASVDVRFDYYLSAFKMFIKHPFLGTGWGDFFHEYTRVKTFHGDEAPHTPHNMVLSFASQAGISGLFASLVVLTAPFYIFYKRSRELKKHLVDDEGGVKWLNIAIITGWCSWGIHALADFNIQVPGTVGVAVILLLIMNSSSVDIHSEGDEKESDSFRRYGAGTLVFWYGCVPIVALVTSLFAYHQLKFEASVSDIIKYVNLSVMQSEKSDDFSEAQLDILLNRSVNMAKYSPIPWMYAANYAVQHKMWNKAEMYIGEALKRSPERAALYYRLSEIQLAEGKKYDAEINLKKAAELFPNAYKPKEL